MVKTAAVSTEKIILDEYVGKHQSLTPILVPSISRLHQVLIQSDNVVGARKTTQNRDEEEATDGDQKILD